MDTSGVVHIFDGRAEYAIREKVENGDDVTATIPRYEDYPAAGVALVGFPDQFSLQVEPRVVFVCYFRRGRLVSSLDHHVTFAGFFGFEPISLEELRGNLPPRFRSHLRQGSLRPATWQALMKTLAQLRPAAAAAISHLSDLRLRPPRGQDESRVAAFERDGVHLALEMSGFPRSLSRQRLLEQAVVAPTVAPFLVELGGANIREDPAIWHDAAVFGDWKQLERYAVGAVVFERGTERLTILNVNRLPVESTLGVDLIYYTHSYKAYVLVQYKSLRRESSDDGGEEWVYRPSGDRSLQREIRRMQAIAPSRWDGSLDGYRLHTGACFLKFCRNHIEDPLSTEMIGGYYVPIDFWKTRVESGQMRGPRGGVVVTPETLGRHFSNTEFTGWVEGGWIGSRGATTERLTRDVREGLQDGKSLLLAVHQPFRGL